MKEVKAWTVAVGNAPGLFSSRKAKRDALAAFKYISTLEGFLGLHPMPPHGTLCIFRTENDAKGARNLMMCHGIKTGLNICEIHIPAEYAEGKHEQG